MRMRRGECPWPLKNSAMDSASPYITVRSRESSISPWDPHTTDCVGWEPINFSLFRHIKTHELNLIYVQFYLDTIKFFPASPFPCTWHLSPTDELLPFLEYVYLFAKSSNTSNVTWTQTTVNNRLISAQTLLNFLFTVRVVYRQNSVFNNYLIILFPPLSPIMVLIWNIVRRIFCLLLCFILHHLLFILSR